MKKYILIVIALFGIFLTNSCSEEDLELSNPNQLSPDTFFSNESQVESSVNAAYANLQPFGLYGRLMFYMMDNMSHENSGNGQQEGDKVTFADFSFDSSLPSIKDYWDGCYRGINKANFVISNTEKINALPEGTLTAAKKAKYIGEARFLRAHYYWLLVNRYGGVPIYLGDGTDNAEGQPRSTKEAVIELIIDDLKYAATNLYDKGAETPGRATKGAAQAFLGKVFLYQESYDLALVEFNKLSGYALEDNYFDNFMEETEHGVESIFEVEYDIALGTEQFWWSPVNGTGPIHATKRGQDYGVLDWFNVYPSDDLVAEFEAGDKRFAGSFYVAGDTYNNGDNTFVESDFAENGGNIRPVAWKKYQNYYKQPSENGESGINVKVIRYSDVLLMMAECENEVGSQTTAIGYINKVRTRAGLDNLDASLSKDAVFKAIVHERKVELNGEQVRFDDMLRWGIVATELAGTNFQVGKNELWPIPDAEISSNANINSEDQNPGF
ncbi:RagB/SusD family nutrient uptake outer membrane protein [Algibacter sp. L4_22]|uniref:RagB/SusD family nutrient uptake outer membrane protein n=1 Tax=Algibacter sp. L4_22 TaxID=2942477 RepID=UPI00201B947D|nr:RagB/SusD family nutrient uptake outer membrane protein [Algibacter sp. L4_22]MCL5130014.1 RagB/SusD family nutrient uptake outer membrane protein [Algibacter sp. L4_22]